MQFVVLVECFLSYRRKLSLVSVTANSEGEKIATKQFYMQPLICIKMDQKELREGG